MQTAVHKIVDKFVNMPIVYDKDKMCKEVMHVKQLCWAYFCLNLMILFNGEAVIEYYGAGDTLLYYLKLQATRILLLRHLRYWHKKSFCRVPYLLLNSSGIEPLIYPWIAGKQIFHAIYGA